MVNEAIIKKEYTLSSRFNLKKRIYIAISLVTILPILVLIYYFSNYVITPVVLIVIVGIVFLGWWIIFEVFSAILRMYFKSQEVVKEMQINLPLKGQGFGNEVESIGAVFNILSSKVKESLDQLQTVNEKTAILNKEISQKVDLLASILQVNSLFSKGASTEELFQILVERLRSIVNADISLCVLRRETKLEYSLNFFSGTELRKVTQVIEDSQFKKLLEIKDEALIKNNREKDKAYNFLNEILGVENIGVFPMYLHGSILGFIIVGFVLKDVIVGPAEKEVMEVFARNISVLWEHRRLIKKVQDLEIFDALTGIYTEKFFHNRLEEEIKRAGTYQRPCGLVVANFSNYSDYQKECGSIETEKFIKKIVKYFQERARPIDILGRIADNQIGVILLERNKRQCRSFVEELSKILKEQDQAIKGLKPGILFAVSENPVDGATANDLLQNINTQFCRGN